MRLGIIDRNGQRGGGLSTLGVLDLVGECLVHCIETLAVDELQKEIRLVPAGIDIGQVFAWSEDDLLDRLSCNLDRELRQAGWGARDLTGADQIAGHIVGFPQQLLGIGSIVRRMWPAEQCRQRRRWLSSAAYRTWPRCAQPLSALTKSVSTSLAPVASTPMPPYW